MTTTQRENACPNRQKHTPSPVGYVELANWAAIKSKTHRQIRCDGCQLFVIWVLK